MPSTYIPCHVETIATYLNSGDALYSRPNTSLSVYCWHVALLLDHWNDHIVDQEESAMTDKHGWHVAMLQAHSHIAGP